MQALILAGGEGTRLRPLTRTVPKPVVPLVDRPFIRFMIDWLHGHGVDDVVMSCGRLASGVRNVLGDGSALGITLRYVEEPRPLGTGGALKYAEPLLGERFLMLNGDVLTDLDLTAQIEQHERTGARATLALTPLGTRRPTGSCGRPVTARSPSSSRSRRRTRSTPTTSRRARTCSSTRCWSCSSLSRTPRSSATCSRGWSATGCTAACPRATGSTSGRPSAICRAPGTSLRRRSRPRSPPHGRRLPLRGAERRQPRPHHPFGAGRERLPDRDNSRVGGRVVLEHGVTVGEHTTIERAVVMQGAEIGSHCTLNGCIVAGGVRIGDHCTIDGMSVLVRASRSATAT